jgi:CheY-like chemotaxis protein
MLDIPRLEPAKEDLLRLRSRHELFLRLIEGQRRTTDPDVMMRFAAEALDVLSKRSEIALVILDLTMPVMTSEQAIPLMKDARPDLPIILTSGYNEAEISRRFTSSGIADVLQKPYTVDALISKVKQGLQTQAQLNQQLK